MIIEQQGDITTIFDGVVCHGCNCFGKMGAGVAVAIRKKWPAAYLKHKQMCDSTEVKQLLLGECQIVAQPETPLGKVYVANLLTQVTYGRAGVAYADIDAIETSLTKAAKFAKCINSPIYSTKIGCGLGGLKWEDVKLVYERVSLACDIDIVVLTL